MGFDGDGEARLGKVFPARIKLTEYPKKTELLSKMEERQSPPLGDQLIRVENGA